MAMSKFPKYSASFPPSVRENPHPFLFVSKVKKMNKVDGTDTDKSEWIKLEFLMDPDNPALGSNYSDSLLSSRMDANSRGLDQVGDGLP
jgi:hypothetical protein